MQQQVLQFGVLSEKIYSRLWRRSLTICILTTTVPVRHHRFAVLLLQRRGSRLRRCGPPNEGRVPPRRPAHPTALRIRLRWRRVCRLEVRLHECAERVELFIDEVDYNQANALEGDKFFWADVTGQPYTGEEEDFDASGALLERVPLFTASPIRPIHRSSSTIPAGTYEGYQAFEYGRHRPVLYKRGGRRLRRQNQLEKLILFGHDLDALFLHRAGLFEAGRSRRRHFTASPMSLGKPLLTPTRSGNP